MSEMEKRKFGHRIDERKDAVEKLGRSLKSNEKTDFGFLDRSVAIRGTFLHASSLRDYTVDMSPKSFISNYQTSRSVSVPIPLQSLFSSIEPNNVVLKIGYRPTPTLLLHCVW
jgi:hypothetical protein